MDKKNIKYTPPSGKDILNLKKSLNKSNKEMAELIGVNYSQSFQQYTTSKKPLNLSFKNCFYLATKLVVSDAELESIYEKMREIGAVVEVPDE